MCRHLQTRTITYDVHTITHMLHLPGELNTFMYVFPIRTCSSISLSLSLLGNSVLECLKNFNEDDCNFGVSSLKVKACFHIEVQLWT